MRRPAATLQAKADVCPASLTIACTVALCAMAALGRAQEGTPSSTASASRPAFRSAVELVALNVTVLDEHRRFVSGLGPDNFAVYENGVKQELAFFGLADVPVDLALLLDLSASMDGRWRSCERRPSALSERFVPAIGPCWSGLPVVPTCCSR
jgi:hypothetical protein